MALHAVSRGVLNRTGSPRAFVLGIALISVLLLIAPSAALRSTAQLEATYQVSLTVGAAPYTYEVHQGGSITLPIKINVSGALPLAAISALIQYNPTELRPTACVARPDGPGGYCNPVYDQANGLVRFNVLASPDTGIMGEAALFDLTFETAASPKLNQINSVTPLIESAADSHGNYMTSQSVGSTIRVLKPINAGAIVYVGTPDQSKPFSVIRGLTTTVPIWVTGVTGLGSATFSLAFNPAVVRPLECRPGFGTCALHADHVAANVISSTGLSGSVLALEIAFTAVGGGSSPLNLTLEAFNTPAGAPIPVRVSNNSIDVLSDPGPALPLLRIEPATQNLYSDARVTVHLFLDRGTEVAAGSWGIRYDPNVLIAETCQFSVGLQNAVCNPSGEPGIVRMALLAAEPLAATTDIATLTFRRNPEAHAGRYSNLTFDVFNFANLAGESAALQHPTRADSATR